MINYVKYNKDKLCIIDVYNIFINYSACYAGYDAGYDAGYVHLDPPVYHYVYILLFCVHTLEYLV